MFDTPRGENLRKAREKKEYTQTQIAEKFKINKILYSAWERGSTITDVHLYQKICRFLEMTPQKI